MKISWIVLTHNRMSIVNRAMKHNFENTGFPDFPLFPGEIIWYDNGSDPQELSKLECGFAHILMHDRENKGVAKGYNRALAMATGDFIMITGCDRLMPVRWLTTWINAFLTIPNTGIISCYSKPIEEVPERIRGDVVYGCEGTPTYRPAIPMEARILRRDLFREIGYFKEDLGLYGWEDVLWSERAEKVTAAKGLVNYVIHDMMSEHLGDEGVNAWSGQDDKEYHEFKKREANDPRKTEVCNQYRKDGHPYYNPFV